ncbi:hypothetical protein SDC9_114047 [bioreactor metagenome]|uniref:Uncharacterized protein n=1 Tax=bioreactor metagenome TaxID=1076179 RepID=A0A645BNR9_9ZZZZ
MPFSVICVSVGPGSAPSPRSKKPLPSASPSRARRATSLRSYTARICWPSSRRICTSSGNSTPLRCSMPTERVWVTSTSPKRSTVRPGRLSASPNTSRQQSASGPITRLRYSHAQRSRRCQNASSNLSFALRDTSRTRILLCGL